ncbi:hypothetical protein B0H13DRAFT_1938945 [Mycena leptocephala]|nr:hypothetical protein B0H13DRAFT_1938945 [Mycena leptocephala]
MLTRIRFINSIALRHYSYYPPSTMTVHSIAESGFGTGNELYDRARPSYQPLALSHIRNAVKTAPPINVVEYALHTLPIIIKTNVSPVESERGRASLLGPLLLTRNGLPPSKS